jgi:hypothetical protein
MPLLVAHTCVVHAAVACILDDCVLAVVVVGIPAAGMDKLDLFAAPSCVVSC